MVKKKEELMVTTIDTVQLRSGKGKLTGFCADTLEEIQEKFKECVDTNSKGDIIIYSLRATELFRFRRKKASKYNILEAGRVENIIKLEYIEEYKKNMEAAKTFMTEVESDKEKKKSENTMDKIFNVLSVAEVKGNDEDNYSDDTENCFSI